MPVKGLNFILSVVLEKWRRQITYYRESLINSYAIFGTNLEFEKSENDCFRLLWGLPVANVNRNYSRTAWPISAIRISLFSKFYVLLCESNLYHLCSSSLRSNYPRSEPLSWRERRRKGGKEALGFCVPNPVLSVIHVSTLWRCPYRNFSQAIIP